jgi:hypothetical protein
VEYQEAGSEAVMIGLLVSPLGKPGVQVEAPQWDRHHESRPVGLLEVLVLFAAAAEHNCCVAVFSLVEMTDRPQTCADFQFR